ncbi:unnamed protein product [Cercopithifilaria johnstoni]|uniref:BPTI/Kunitz inhibitor domain-containing protein n=1 Tax=Cercopithifilaria johnstoni TaxID=2874296 RepID=A0A8J2Q1A5_9BILA|nr:unnamed protein product [Cercopithifilaria johnstoni]
MLLLLIVITVIKICLADMKEISECEWITCLLPKVCQNINGIISCILPDDAMKTEMEEPSEAVRSANQMNLMIESVSSRIPDSSTLPLSVPEIGLFPPSDTVTKQEPLVNSENYTVKTLPEICWLPVVTGPCSKAKILWYYNFLTGRCGRFSFSGCGNANHFYTRKECEETCLVTYST